MRPLPSPVPPREQGRLQTITIGGGGEGGAAQLVLALSTRVVRDLPDEGAGGVEGEGGEGGAQGGDVVLLPADHRGHEEEVGLAGVFQVLVEGCAGALFGGGRGECW